MEKREPRCFSVKYEARLSVRGGGRGSHGKFEEELKGLEELLC